MEKDVAEKICVCRICPSYVNCGEKPAFCMPAGGKSKCIKLEKGCVCSGCPVQEKMRYKFVYYCTRGSENELAGHKNGVSSHE